jgi:hypothetical protein
MEFRDYAAKETTGLLSRLLASQAETSVRHLRTLRDALDAAAATIEADAASPQADEEIQELIRRLNTAAGTAARAAAQKVQKEGQAALDAANEELKAQREHTDRLVATFAEERAQMEAQADALRQDLRRESERAEAADRDLDAAIDAHAQVDAQRVEAETALRQQTQARASLEKDLNDVRALLDETVADAAHASADLDAARAETAAITTALDAARQDAEHARRDAAAALDAAKRALDAERDQNDQLSNSLAEAQAQAEMLRADLVDAKAHADALQASLARETERADAGDRDLDAAIEAHAAVDAARIEAEATARREAQRCADLERELAEVRSQLEAATAHVGKLSMQVDAHASEKRTLEADLSAAHAELDAARTQREAITTQLEATRARVKMLERHQMSQENGLRSVETSLNEALQAEASARELAATAEADVARARADMAALQSEVGRLGSLLDASIHSLDELAAATSVTDLLSSLVRQLSVEFSRVALFRVKGNRLEGEYQIGFDETTDVTKLVLPLNTDSLITKAASSGLVEELRGSELDDSSRAPFGGTPTSALALPVSFQGETLAVIYADSDQTPSDPEQYDASAGFAKLMVRATAVMMMRLSQELKTLGELREYAAMLLQEAEEMYAADRQAGRSEDERRSRLQDTVECARQLYAQRAALEGAAAASLLDDKITAANAAEPQTPFARDLAMVAGSLAFDARHTAAS